MKKLKKVLALCLAFVMCAVMIAGCGGPENAPATTDAGGAASESAGDKDAGGEAADAGEAPAPAAEGSQVVAGLICLHDENSTYDLNFINAFKSACEAEGLVEGETYFISTGIPEGQECYEEAMNMVDRGCNFVFADSFGHEDYLIQAARECPEVQFCHATGTKAHTENLSNFHNAFASIYMGRYLGGVAAGLKLNEMIEAGDIKANEAKLGYVGAFTYAEVISGYTSYYLGAKSVCPTVTMDVTFTGSWYDETKEKEGAQALIEGGCKVLSQHADSMGAPTACEKAGVPDISYNGSTIDACPKTFVVSSSINWAPYYKYVMDCIKGGKAIDADWVGTIDTDSVILSDINEAVAAKDTKKKIEEVKASLLDGSIKVFDTSTFTVDGKPLDSYKADVDTDPAYEGDTEVIKDGTFQESVFRSAPYFDLKIDGITLLDTAF